MYEEPFVNTTVGELEQLDKTHRIKKEYEHK